MINNNDYVNKINDLKVNLKKMKNIKTMRENKFNHEMNDLTQKNQNLEKKCENVLLLVKKFPEIQMINPRSSWKLQSSITTSLNEFR